MSVSNTSGDGAVVVLGAGPAGLTAAETLARAGRPTLVFERGEAVGGLARTENYKGFRFDLGGHRFYTKSAVVQRFWSEVLGPDLLLRPRLSRIFYRGRFFHYPLQAANVLRGLGLRETALSVASYARRKAFPHRVEDTFEQWVTNRFGDRLFRTFFKEYTEKVWGRPCAELRAEWAAQRIKDLSLSTLVRHALGLEKAGVRSLVEQFHYPRLGPGMLWEAVRRRAEQAGGRVVLQADVVRLEREGRRVLRSVVRTGDGLQAYPAEELVSSIPIATFVSLLDPPAPPEVRHAAAQLRHRDYLTVCVIVKRAQLFPDNWIYVHEPGVRVARIQNFKNWSGEMVPDPAKTSLGLEYFCARGDELWGLDDAALLELAGRELETLGLARRAELEDGCVFRVPQAYPIYDVGYREQLARVRDFLSEFVNVQTIGRNGLHRYNNQDHAVLCGLLAARGILDGRRRDLWRIGEEAAYYEEAADTPSDCSASELLAASRSASVATSGSLP